MKHVKDSTPEEAAATLAALKRSQSSSEPPPLPEGQKMARDMTESEREAFLKNQKRKFA